MDFSLHYNRLEAHPASCSQGNGGYITGVKRPEEEHDFKLVLGVIMHETPPLLVRLDSVVFLAQSQLY
jgi:hypothetical protein